MSCVTASPYTFIVVGMSARSADRDTRTAVQSFGWFVKTTGEALELFDSQPTRLSRSLRRAFDRHQFHRVALRRHITTPHRVIPQHSEQTTNVRLALRCQRERVKPEFDGTGLHVRRQTLSTRRNDEIAKPDFVCASLVDTLCIFSTR